MNEKKNPSHKSVVLAYQLRNVCVDLVFVGLVCLFGQMDKRSDLFSLKKKPHGETFPANPSTNKHGLYRDLQKAKSRQSTEAYLKHRQKGFGIPAQSLEAKCKKLIAGTHVGGFHFPVYFLFFFQFWGSFPIELIGFCYPIGFV